jgi:hypothetical protein
LNLSKKGLALEGLGAFSWAAPSKQHYYVHTGYYTQTVKQSLFFVPIFLALRPTTGAEGRMRKMDLLGLSWDMWSDSIKLLQTRYKLY